jgi:hypothetical protein
LEEVSVLMSAALALISAKPVSRAFCEPDPEGFLHHWAFHRTNVEFGKTLVAERIGLKATVEPRVT